MEDILALRALNDPFLEEEKELFRITNLAKEAFTLADLACNDVNRVDIDDVADIFLQSTIAQPVEVFEGALLGGPNKMGAAFHFIQQP